MPEDEKKEVEEEERKEPITYFIQPKDSVMDVIFELKFNQE